MPLRSLRKVQQGHQGFLQTKSAIRLVPHLPRRGVPAYPFRLCHGLWAVGGKSSLSTNAKLAFRSRPWVCRKRTHSDSHGCLTAGSRCILQVLLFHVIAGVWRPTSCPNSGHSGAFQWVFFKTSPQPSLLFSSVLLPSLHCSCDWTWEDSLIKLLCTHLQVLLPALTTC